MSAEFWNGIIADHAASQIRATKTVTPGQPLAPIEARRGETACGLDAEGTKAGLAPNPLGGDPA